MEHLEFPFLGEYFYVKYPSEYKELVDKIKEQLKRFLIVKLEKVFNESKIFTINTVALLDVYVPPVNVLVIAKVFDENGKEKFSIEVSNSIHDVLADSMDKSKAGLLIEKNEKITLEIYMAHDHLFVEGVRTFSNIHKESTSFVETEKVILQQIENKLKEINYKLIDGIDLLEVEKIKKILDIFPSFVKEESI